MAGDQHAARLRRLSHLAAHLQNSTGIQHKFECRSNPGRPCTQPRVCRTAAAAAGARAPNAAELASLRERSRRAWAEHRARPAPRPPFTSWVQGTRYGDADSARSTADTDRRVGFDAHGFLHLRQFAPPGECDAMLARMHELVEGWDPVGELVGFNTRAKEQLDEQGSSDYFLDSADQIHFFAELGAIDEATGGLVGGLSKHRALNKVGHGLHLHDGVFRSYAQALRMRELLRELGWRDPVLPQSMYIFKQPLIGAPHVGARARAHIHTLVPSLGIYP